MCGRRLGGLQGRTWNKRAGLCPQEEIAKLLRYESSALPAGQLTSLPDYASRMQPGSRTIYYLCAPSRQLAEHSPYYEAVKQKNMEVGVPWARAGLPVSECPKEGLLLDRQWLDGLRMGPGTLDDQAAQGDVWVPGGPAELLLIACLWG